jgi:GAF domain-containing protein
MPKPTIICVDDEKTILSGLKQELEFSLGATFDFEVAESAEEGLDLLQELIAAGVQVPVVISDQLMPGMKGDEFLIEVQRTDPHIRKILLTGQASADAVGNALNHGGLYRYVSKPWETNDLRLTVAEAAKSYLASRELANQLQILSGLNESIRVMTGTVALAPLAETFLRQLLNDTEAPRGLLRLLRGAKVVLEVSGTFSLDGIGISVLKPDDDDDDDATTIPAWPFALLDKVAEIRQPILFADAAKQPAWATDPYISHHKTRSIYAAPIVRGEQLLAVVYLEDTQRPGFFTDAKQAYLSLMTGQAAIFFDNAYLYENLEAQVQARTLTIEEQNQDIHASMRYGRRIQAAILPNEALVRQHLPQSFVLLKPREIVSGDFHWLHPEADRVLVAAAESGRKQSVPGAFVSLLGNALLARLVIEDIKRSPAELIQALDERIRSSLFHSRALLEEQRKVAQEGVSITIAELRPRTSGGYLLSLAQANTHVLIVEPNGAGQLLASAQPAIGEANQAVLGAPPASTTHELLSGQAVYFFSDGCAAQLGGPSGEEIGWDRLAQIVLAANAKPMEAQSAAIWEAINQWRGELPQTDDVLIFGIRA